ncbi:sigma-54-dependent transcriptional regulator [Terasakiella pusilla]|uniref:sigma-54-dependent transcriptional regulator n=1 Tax=Terasakiella pusilla TaxID=64973 RepID=UPI003AA7FBE6
MKILIVGTLNGQVGAASQIAVKRGAKVIHTDDIREGLDTLRQGKGVDLVLVDIQLDIETFISNLNAERINTPVVACGVATDAKAAVRAIRAGAQEYLPLPPDAELIGAVLSAVAEESHAMIYHDPAMDDVVRLGKQIAPSDASVLITGQSGTGKEIMARFIHRNSKRKDGPFIAVNCAAIPENLLESELFGHEKGAFTGAVARRIGKFEEANNGTILLDEISEMDPRLQAKLLRILQEREIDRVGGKKPVPVNVRVLATSNRNMEQSVAKGEFREDLYFRLNVVNLQLPSLKERPKDIAVLAEHFIKKYAAANDLPVRPLTDPAKRKILQHNWPGNVRELENTMHRAVLVAGPTEIDDEAIMINGQPQAGASAQSGGQMGTGNPGDFVGQTVADMERKLIIATLDHCLGNRTHAANVLGISIRTLRNKLKLYGEEGFNVPAAGGNP